jgi:transposase InsO family protein
MLQNFQNYKTFVEKQIGHQLKCLRSDNGGEYISNNFNYEGIQQQLTIPHTPQQNGVAERKI